MVVVFLYWNKKRICLQLFLFADLSEVAEENISTIANEKFLFLHLRKDNYL